MRWIAMLLICFCALLTLACAPDGLHYGRPDTETETEEPDPGLFNNTTSPRRLHCPGECVTGAPATYTGPSPIWLGSPGIVPECPLDIPHPGIEGYTDLATPEYARECLITLSDLCPIEGETCVPPPRDDFQLCIHKPGIAGCTDTHYPVRRTMSDVDTDDPITLCCEVDGAR